MYSGLLEGRLEHNDHKAKELAAYLQRHLDEAGGLRPLEKRTKVSKGSLENIIEHHATPKLSTLAKLSAAFGTPLWRLVEMSGFDLGLPNTLSDRMRRLASLVEEMPDLAPIVDHLLAIHPEDLDGILAVLEAQQIRRQRSRSSQG